MACKYVILALVFSLKSQPMALIDSSRPKSSSCPPSPQSQTFSVPLIENSCLGVVSFESKCLSSLQSPSHQKADANGLAFFTLRFVESNAANLSNAIQALAKDPNLPPLLQSALNDCTEQYTPLDDIVEDAINIVLANSYPDAQQFIQVGIANIDECDTGLKRNYVQEKAEKNSRVPRI